MSFNDKLKSDLEENKEIAANTGSNDWFKFEEGDNQFRILVEPQVLFEKYKVGICYTGCGYVGTTKYLTWILDKKDNKVKLFKMPYGIAKQIGVWEQDEDYAFDSFPMPYDIKVTATNAGTKEVEYAPMPKPHKELTAEEQIVVNEKMNDEKTLTPQQIIDKMKEKLKAEHEATGFVPKDETQDEPVIDRDKEDITPEDVSF